MEILLPRSARRWRADALKTYKVSTAVGSEVTININLLLLLLFIPPVVKIGGLKAEVKTKSGVTTN